MERRCLRKCVRIEKARFEGYLWLGWVDEGMADAVDPRDARDFRGGGGERGANGVGHASFVGGFDLTFRSLYRERQREISTLIWATSIGTGVAVAQIGLALITTSGARDDRLERQPRWLWSWCLVAMRGSPILKECGICLGSFKKGEECCVLKTCDHGYHESCVMEWASRDKCCPLCRGSIQAGRAARVTLTPANS
ncbi:hypothetical protein NL676_014805 [Syzygium grande]|nr:hypothetical protein NL676_014805 [Syzygium grande]